jgi:hypothetical protein
MAVVVLNPIPLLGVDSSSEAPSTMTPVTRVGFMSIQHSNIKSPYAAQSLVTFQAGIDLMQPLSQLA